MSSNENAPEWTPPAPAAGNPPYPAPQYPAQQYPPPAAQPFQYAPGFFPPPAAPAPPRRRRKLVLLIAAVAVIVLAAGGAVGWQLLHKAPSLSYQGKAVTDPSAALEQAEQRVFTLTSRQPTNTGADNHCYYAVPNSGTSAQRQKVDQGIYCGPMALLDSKSGEAFLHFTVSGTAAGSHVRLTASDNPELATTEKLPDGFSLVRPGSSARHTTFAAVPLPTAPAGAPDTFISAAAVGPTRDLLRSRHGNWMFGRDGGVELFSLASVPYVGKAGSARSAAPGQKLLAFVLTYEGPTDTGIKGLDLGVVVGSKPEQKIPALDELSNYKVISVPTDVSKVSLVLKSEGITQTLSLLDGARGAEDIDLTTRYHYGQTLNVTKDLPVVLSDNGQSENTTIHMTVKGVHLEYFEHLQPNKYQTPANPKTAYLHVELSYTIDGDPDNATYQELGSPDLEVTDAAGKHYVSTDLLPDDDDLAYEVFTVPANFTDGQIVFGAGTKTFSDGSSELITPSVTIPIHIAAG